VRIERLNGDDAGVRALLVELALDEQDRYAHPRQTRQAIESGMPPLQPGFAGENHILVARGESGHAQGLCWCVLFDPGTGLEGEVAEVYVRPEARGRGLATQLLREAMAAYRAAGFTPTEQTVLTWLPLDSRDNRAP
jgi:GNAT superfamily N-acetyltransferase